MSRRKRRYIADVPHLCRQRGKKKFWTGWIDGEEVSLGTADARAAQQRLDALVEERRRAATAAQATPQTTLTQLAEKYIEYIQPPRKTAKTVRTYENRVLAFVERAEELGVVLAEQVDYKFMSQYIRERMDTGVEARTVNRDVAPIGRMFDFGRRERLIGANPFLDPDFKDLKLEEAQPAPNLVTLSPAQVDSFIARAYQDLHVGYAALFELTAGSGIRIDEARHLELVDLDDETGFLTITPKKGWKTKNYRYRRIPVSKATLAAARAFIAARSEVRLDDKATWTAIESVRLALKLPHFSMHDLRRAWGSAVHANGASLKQVSAWLGHCGVAVTERYIRTFETTETGHQFLPR